MSKLVELVKKDLPDEFIVEAPRLKEKEDTSAESAPVLRIALNYRAVRVVSKDELHWVIDEKTFALAVAWDLVAKLDAELEKLKEKLNMERPK